jgi:hypothetical protein
VVYELYQTDKRKAKNEIKITEACKKSSDCKHEMKSEIEEWKQLCSVRMTLVAKRDKMEAALYVYTRRSSL